ncbi:MAG: hypothetical protein AAGI09_07685 [Pseudomonadota bacterium]
MIPKAPSDTPEHLGYAPPGLGKTALRLGIRIVAILAIAFVAQALITHAMDTAGTLPEATRGPVQLSVLLLALTLYALLIAIPFVPGIEIGVTLLVLQGASIAPFVYGATVLGLGMAFMAGRALPYAWLHGVFQDLRLRKACALLDQISVLSPERRLALLRSRLPDWLGPYVIRYRYLALAAALNLPGNSVIGGGGGLSLIAGLSRLYRPRATLLTTACAAAPVPVAVWILGPGILGS